ncbi:MAG: hypothetical protein WBM46_00185 [Polyangiales bacterium]
MSDGAVTALLLMLALMVAPILMAGFVALLALPLIAEHDPEVLFGGETNDDGVPKKVAIAGAVLALCGGFCVALAFVGEVHLGWLFFAWIFWAPAFQLLFRPTRKPKPPEAEDVPWKHFVPRLALVLVLGALIGAKVAGAISANEFFVGVGVYVGVLFLLKRFQRR